MTRQSTILKKFSQSVLDEGACFWNRQRIKSRYGVIGYIGWLDFIDFIGIWKMYCDFWRCHACHVAFEALEAPSPSDWTEHFDSSAAASADLILDGPKMSRASHFSLPGTTTESKTCETCETGEKMGLWGSGLLLQRIYKSKLLVVVLAMTPPDAVGYYHKILKD